MPIDPRLAQLALRAAALRRAGAGAPQRSATPAAAAAAPTAPPYKKGGKVKVASGGFTRAADGIAQKGKTKAKQIIMKRGGKC